MLELTNYRLPSERQQIARSNLNKVSVFIIDNHFNVRTIFKQHLSTVSTRRNNAVKMLLVNSDDCIEFSLSI